MPRYQGEQVHSLLDGLAENPALPRSTLDRVVAVADQPLGVELARRDDLSAEHVLALLGREDPVVTSALLERGWVRPAEVPVSNPEIALVVAGHSDVPPSVVRSLAAHPDPAVRSRLPEWALHLPADVISLLAADSDERVVAQVVSFHPLPEALAWELSGHPGTEVRRALAGSPHTPPAVLVRLGSAESTFVRELAGNPMTPAATAAELIRDPVSHHRLAGRTDLGPRVYEQLSELDQPGVLAELAGNPAVPAHVLRRLTGTRALRRALARNPAIPLDLLAEVAADVGPLLLPRVASATSAELRTLASSTTAAVRMLAATRQDLPPDLVARLAGDPDPGVASVMVTNPALTVQQVRDLVSRHGPPIFPHAARNPLCPANLLHHLASHAESAETYRAIARHPHSRGETLLLCLEDARARHLAAAHPHLPVPAIVELLGSEFTARPAAANPSLPVHVMEELLSSTT